jgi:hypothetical protein
VQEAYRDLTNASRWSYLLRQGRLVTSAMESDGTIAYTQGNLQVTLTPDPSSTFQAWPSYAVGCYIRIGFVACKIVKRISDTVVQLDDQVNFGEDQPAGTPYLFYRDSYVLPDDFIANDQALYERNFGGMQYVHPREWLFEERFIFAQGIPQCYTITGDPLFPGKLLIRLTPLPAEQKTIDYVYHRRPRPLVLAGPSAGTVSIVSGGSTVTGVGTTFGPAMTGSVLRLGTSATTAPTGVIGKNPAAFETYITDVTSGTSLTCQDMPSSGFSGVAYTVGDPVDIDENSMLNAFLRCCEMHLAMNRTLKDKPEAAAFYLDALNKARAADARTFSGRSVGDHWPYRQRLRDMPIDLSRLS